MNITQKAIIIALFGVPMLLGSLLGTNPMNANGQLEDLFVDIPTFASDNQTLMSSNLELNEGQDGLPGLDGQDGSDGQAGLDAQGGLDGQDGQDGSDGKAGVAGNDGARNLIFEQ
jgi:hypothetical protein